MKKYLKQEIEDTLADAFYVGVIGKETYFKVLKDLEKDKNLFTVWLN